MNAAAADGCISAELGNFLFFCHLTLLLQPHASNSVRVNQPLPGSMVVLQLVKQSLPIPEIRGSNPVIG